VNRENWHSQIISVRVNDIGSVVWLFAVLGPNPWRTIACASSLDAQAVKLIYRLGICFGRLDISKQGYESMACLERQWQYELGQQEYHLRWP
jgi:hypothetical protein